MAPIIARFFIALAAILLLIPKAPLQAQETGLEATAYAVVGKLSLSVSHQGNWSFEDSGLFRLRLEDAPEGGAFPLLQLSSEEVITTEGDTTDIYITMDVWRWPWRIKSARKTIKEANGGQFLVSVSPQEAFSHRDGESTVPLDEGAQEAFRQEMWAEAERVFREAHRQFF